MGLWEWFKNPGQSGISKNTEQLEAVVPEKKEEVKSLTLEEIQNLNYESGKRVADKLDEVADKLKENDLGRTLLIDVKDAMAEISDKLRDGSQATAAVLERFDAAALQAVEQVEYLWKYSSSKEYVEDTVERLKEVLMVVRFSTDTPVERVKLKYDIGIMWLDIIAQQGIIAECVFRRDENQARLDETEETYYEAKQKYKAGTITEKEFAYTKEIYNIEKQISTTIDMLNTQIETLKQTVARIELAIANAKPSLNSVVMDQETLDKLEKEFEKLADEIVIAAKTRHEENVKMQEKMALIQERLLEITPVVIDSEVEEEDQDWTVVKSTVVQEKEQTNTAKKTKSRISTM